MKLDYDSLVVKIAVVILLTRAGLCWLGWPGLQSSERRETRSLLIRIKTNHR